MVSTRMITPVFSKVMEGALRYRDVVPDAMDSIEAPSQLMITRPIAGLASLSTIEAELEVVR